MGILVNAIYRCMGNDSDINIYTLIQVELDQLVSLFNHILTKNQLAGLSFHPAKQLSFGIILLLSPWCSMQLQIVMSYS